MPRHRGVGFVRQPELPQRARAAVAARVLVEGRERQEPVPEQAEHVRSRDLGRLRAAHDRTAAAKDGKDDVVQRRVGEQPLLRRGALPAKSEPLRER